MTADHLPRLSVALTPAGGDSFKALPDHTMIPTDPPPSLLALQPGNLLEVLQRQKNIRQQLWKAARNLDKFLPDSVCANYKNSPMLDGAAGDGKYMIMHTKDGRSEFLMSTDDQVDAVRILEELEFQNPDMDLGEYFTLIVRPGRAQPAYHAICDELAQHICPRYACN